MSVNSIRSRLAITISLLLLGFLGCVAVIGYRVLSAEFKQTIATQQYAMLQLVADNLDRQLAHNQKMLQQIAADIRPADIARPEKIQRLLQDEKDGLVIFDGGFSVVDARGHIVTEHPTELHRKGMNMLHRDYVRKTLETGKPFISQPYKTSLAPHHPTITFSVPILNADGSVAGVLAGRHDLLRDNYLSSTGSVKIGKTGYLYLLADNRTLIMHPDQKRILEVVAPGINQGLDQAIAGFDGSMENTNSRGVKGISSFRRLRQANWIIVSHFPLAEAYAPLERISYLFGVFAGVLLIAFLIMVWIVSRQVTSPLSQLAGHLKQLPLLQAKNRDIRLRTSVSEFRQLATVFNDIMAELAAQQQKLAESQEIYRIMAEFTSELAVVRSPDGSVRYISDNCKIITGYEAQEYYANASLLDIIVHPDDREHWYHHRHELDAVGACSPFDLRIVTKNGDLRWLNHTCHTVYAENGEMLVTRGSFRDITPRIDMEKRLNEQRLFAEQILESSSAPIFVLDRCHRVIFWNRALAELTGCSAEEMLETTRHWSAFYSSERPTLADLLLDGQLNRLDECYGQYCPVPLMPQVMRAEGWFHNLNGQDRYLFFEAAPVYSSEGTMVAVIETLQEITQLKVVEERLHLFQQAMEQTASSVVITDQTGSILYVNRKFCEISGYTAQEAIGQNPRMLKSGRQSPEVYADLWQTITNGQPWHGEFHNRRKDGTLFWELVNITPLLDNQGTITHFLAVKEDITARKEAEYTLRKQRAELVVKNEQLQHVNQLIEKAKKEWEDTMDCIGDMVLLVGPQGNIIRCNRVVTDFAGMSYAELKDRTWWGVLFPETDLEQLKGNTGELYHRPSGRWFYLNSYSFDAQQGKSVVTLHDLTEVKKVAQELAGAYDELKSTHMQLLQQEKMASIGQLAAGVAHEINNPMGFISSNLQSLGKYLERIKTYIDLQGVALDGIASATADHLAAERKRLKIDYLLEDIPKLLAESADGAERVRNIVQNLKSFSRVDESEQKEANLNDCLESTVSIAWNELKYKCTVEKEYGEIPPVKCYPQQLNQVFLNLIVNGAHAIDTQGTIRLRTWQDGAWACVAISDTGSGIPEEIRSRIFEPFFTTKAVGKGTGLGLSISYDIVKKHNGSIDVQSVVGEGTTFTVRLPLGVSGE